MKRPRADVQAARMSRFMVAVGLASRMARVRTPGITWLNHLNRPEVAAGHRQAPGARLRHNLNLGASCAMRLSNAGGLISASSMATSSPVALVGTQRDDPLICINPLRLPDLQGGPAVPMIRVVAEKLDMHRAWLCVVKRVCPNTHTEGTRDAPEPTRHES